MDARRNQVYTGIYRFEAGELRVLEEQTAVSLEELMEKINEMGQEVIFLGDGVPVYREKIEEKVRVPYHFAPAHMNKQRAGAVAVRALAYFREGKTVSAKEHQPNYLRLSQAERERAEKEKTC